MKIMLFCFLGITVLTALITLMGMYHLWFDSEKTDLPYIGWLLSSVILEIVGIIIIYVQKGAKYLPEVKEHKTKLETAKFMQDFISSGSSATVFSNRVSWLIGNKPLLDILQDKSKMGLKVEIVTPEEVENEIRISLPRAIFIVTGEKDPPDSRFTLINGDRTGSERLAIAKGSHPNHEITIFDTNSGPQIIAMAKDIIRKSRSLKNAN